MKTKITRELILNTAISLGDQKGLKNLTLKDIANALHIKTPSLYNHIKGLDDVYNMFAYHGLQLLKNDLLNSAIGLSGYDALVAMAHAYRDFAMKSPSLYESTQWIDIWKEEETQTAAQDIVDIISKVISVFQLSEDENIHFIRVLRAYLHGFSSLDVNHSFGMDINIQESFDYGLRCLFHQVGIPHE